jgi:hypothetical protein
LSLKRLALGWSAKGERAKALETWWRLWRSTSDAFQKEQIRKQIDALGGTVEGGESRSRE